jgi:hypothetical protein
LRLFFCHGEQIGDERQSCSLGDRLQLVDQGGDVIRGLAPRQIGSVDGPFWSGAFLDRGAPFCFF